MTDMTKDIVGRLAVWIVDYATMSATLGDQVKEVENGLREDFPILESLSPPDGVGLTRYRMWAKIDWTVDPDVDPEGEWVRHEDAAAALAAEKARGDGLEKALADAKADADVAWSYCERRWGVDRAALSVQPEETNP